MNIANKTIIVLKSRGMRGGGGGGGGDGGNRGSGTGTCNRNIIDATDQSDRNIWSRKGRKFDING